MAYRYFSTPRRKFIIADTPGHEQYTRNMATGASTADLAIILIDARNGVLPQSRRHAFIASLLGIPHLVVAVNKMDLVDFGEDVFDDIRARLPRLRRASSMPATSIFIPISALDGDNVVTRSAPHAVVHRPDAARTPGNGATSPATATCADFRFPVQYVIRPDLDFRGYRRPGRLRRHPPGRRGHGAALRPHQPRQVASSPATATCAEAFAPMSVTLSLEDEIDVSRGDMLVARRATCRTWHAASRPSWCG